MSKDIDLLNDTDEKILAQIAEMIANHTKKRPYSRNTLVRIKDLLERYGV